MPQAWLGVCKGGILNWGRTELAFTPTLESSGRDPNVAAAFSNRDFGIRVRGAKYVRALRDFHRTMTEGDVMFAGLFFERSDFHLEGLLLANRKFLGDRDKAQLAQAQRNWESSLRLKALANTEELSQQMRKIAGRSPRNLGAKWLDEAQTSIGYYLSSGNGVREDFGGPHTREQLLDWAKAGYSYFLEPLQKRA